MGNTTIGEIIGLIFLIPVIIGASIYLVFNINNPDALLNYLPKFIENVATPWEIGILEPLSKMGE
ncbi:hypothetical protein [Methanocaldococcus fervens]|uniref:Uncharacterized protein n=1 Tax=Methanocaldococcus fervens (strain DSM 4213 / JCM 15782 / AG86) TaxID=573064 RepID=C7P6A8_METFA|nr:hypothetical protein [Methanocaldococcus fervens]ACV24090.1 hypothetical protein Mefer_0252 [Methanocaldococcus fervens AG86]